MPRKKNSKVKSKKKQQQQHSSMVLDEIARCIIHDCKTVNGHPMLFYQKLSDETLKCCMLDSHINLSPIKIPKGT